MRLAERANDGLHAHVVERLVRLLPDRDGRVIDIGCGTGALLSRLRSLGYWNLAGIDIAPPRDVPGIEFIESDLDDWRTSLASGSVDLALAVEVVEHVENLGGLLDELFRLLKPGGAVLLTTPNLHSVEARLRLLLTGKLKQFDALGDPTHVTPIFRFPFERTLQRHAFSVVQAWGFPEDGFSPTSRPGLRVLGRVARLLGARGQPDGDQLCMQLRRDTASAEAGTAGSKREVLTAHY